MALKIPGLKFFSTADAKSRVFIVFAAVVGFAFVIYLAVRFLGGGTTGPGSRVANAPGGLQSVPGAKMSPEFYRAVEQANQQAAQQAQISGGSAVPTLINVPSQQTNFNPAPQSGNCTVLCNEEAVNVADDINDLVKSSKLSQEDANKLLDLAKRNVSVAEYADALNELVREGKLTPEQARRLLEEYKKQHANALTAESGQALDSLIKSGQLPLDAANQLLALQKSGASAADYAAELNELVREGKISPETAARLLGQYSQMLAKEVGKGSEYAIRQMVKSGEITADVAKDLIGFEDRHAPLDDFSAELDRLVAAGKMTPAAAAKLLAEYKKQRESVGGVGSLNSMLSQEQANAVQLLSDLLKSGAITSEAANALYALQQKCVSQAEYQAALEAFKKDGKVKPAAEVALMEEYKKLGGLCSVSKQLTGLQSNNASIADYTKALKDAVQAGLIPPDIAANLLREYKGIVSPGIAPTVETNIPGTENFAKLSQRVQQEQATGPQPNENGQFDAAAMQAAALASQQEQQAIAQLSAAMSSQAQSLIASWQVVPMTEVRGSASDHEKGKGLFGGKGGSSSTTTTTETSSGPVIIKAGTILFAVLDTGIDSDYPNTPVLATIVDGQYKGAKVLGKMQVSSANNGLSGNDRLAITFNLMNRDEWPHSKPITAFAIDPDTARTIMASDVNYHYLERYGAMFAGSFLTGYSSAITQSGAVNSTGIFGTTTTTAPISPAGKLAVGLGQVGTALSQAVSSYVNIPPTVKVNSGVGIGILFMSDLSL